jgi:hypothetical protein
MEEVDKNSENSSDFDWKFSAVLNYEFRYITT